jgi:hypothetical protein
MSATRSGRRTGWTSYPPCFPSFDQLQPRRVNGHQACRQPLFFEAEKDPQHNLTGTDSSIEGLATQDLIIMVCTCPTTLSDGGRTTASRRTPLGASHPTYTRAKGTNACNVLVTRTRRRITAQSGLLTQLARLDRKLKTTKTEQKERLQRKPKTQRKQKKKKKKTNNKKKSFLRKLPTSSCPPKSPSWNPPPPSINSQQQLIRFRPAVNVTKPTSAKLINDQAPACPR